MEPTFKSVEQADKSSVVQPPFTELHKALLLLMIATYFCIIFVWVSTSGPFKWAFLSCVRPVIIALEIGQSWDLFSPNVRTVNVHMNALITFKDGSTRIYEFPRMEKLDLLAKFQREKQRKLFLDNLPYTYFEFLPATARFIARANLNPSNPPVTVTLSKNWANMPLPDPNHWHPKSAGFPLHGFHETLITYHVLEQDLQ